LPSIWKGTRNKFKLRGEVERGEKTISVFRDRECLDLRDYTPSLSQFSSSEPWNRTSNNDMFEQVANFSKKVDAVTGSLEAQLSAAQRDTALEP